MAIGQRIDPPSAGENDGVTSHVPATPNSATPNSATPTFVAPTTVVLGSVELGSGMPAVCVPLMASTVGGLRAAAAAVPPGVVDVVEMRIDFLDDGTREATVRDAVSAVREVLPDAIPILLTFRSRAEGGNRDITPEAYESVLRGAVAGGRIEAIDVEMFTEPAARDRIVADARRAGVAVVMSSHDFTATPPRDEIVSRLRAQQQWGADVVKIAVMPHEPADVIALLDATVTYTAGPGARPAITMAMGELGLVSRIAGETFGSCLTFGAIGTASAPGQIEADRLRAVLDVLHRHR